MTQYIDKAAVVAEIERRIKEHHSGYLVCLKDILSFLDTLEVKEVGERTQHHIPMEDIEKAAARYDGSMDCVGCFIGGAKWMEEQIMKDAIEREVKKDAGGYPYIDATELYDYDNDKPLAKVGDKIKVLIVKDK